MEAIANAGGGIDASTQLAVAAVTASGDISARDVIVSRELHVDGAAILNSLTVGGANVLSALAAKQDALTSSTALSCSTLSASGAITSNGGGFENAGRVNSSGWGAEYAWFSQNVQRWSLYLKPQTSNLQMWTANGGKGSTYEINYGTGHVSFMGGSTNVSDASLKSTPEDASTEDCLQMLRQVSARTYSRLDLEPGKSRIGLIAQEVRDAAPPAFGGLIESCSHSNSQGGDAEREILTLDYARLSAVLWQCTRSIAALPGGSARVKPCAIDKRIRGWVARWQFKLNVV